VLLIGGHHSLVIGLQQTFHELSNLNVNVLELRFDLLKLCFNALTTLLPQIREHLPREVNNFGRRCECFNNITKFTLNFVSSYRFAVALAGLLEAHIVRMLLPCLAL